MWVVNEGINTEPLYKQYKSYKLISNNLINKIETVEK